MAQQVTFKLTVDNKGIVKGSRRATKEVKAVDRATGEAKKQTGALSKAWQRFGNVVTAVAVGAVIQRTFRRAIQVGKEFQTQLADLEAITGITGDQLEFLGDSALETSKRYGVAATEIVEAQKLVASQLAEKIDFGTEAGLQELRQVADEAVVLQRAAGIDLETAVGATTTALNQFNLEASETSRIVNTIAAGSKLGAAETRDQAEAYREAGTAFAGAGQTIEGLNASVQVLAANAIRGSRAGTGLRNIITRLETRADRLAEHGFGNLNLRADGFAVTMGKLTPLLDDVTARSEIFGEEGQALASILIQNAEGLQDMESAVTGTDTAVEQAEVKMQTFDAAMQKMSSTMDNRLIKSFQATNGVGVKFINMITWAIDEVGEAIENVNHWMTSHKDLRSEFELTETRIRQTIRTSQDAIKEIEREIEARDLQGEALQEAQQAIKDLEGRYTSILPEFEAYEESLQNQIETQKANIQELDESNNMFGKNDHAMHLARVEIERLELRLKNAKDAQAIYREEVRESTKAQDDQTDSTEKTADATKKLSEQIKEKKDQIEELLNQDGDLSESDRARLRRLEAERRELTQIVEKRERMLQLQVDAMERETEQIGVEEQLKQFRREHLEQLGEENLRRAKKVEVTERGARVTEEGAKRETGALKNVEGAMLRAGSAAIMRAGSAKEAANAVIDSILSEIVAIAIKKVVAGLPFPANVLAVPAVAGLARGFRSLIPGFQDGGVVSGGSAGGSGMTTPGQKLITINERRNPEYIVNDRSTEEALPLLERINSSPSAARAISRQVMGFAGGGRVTGADLPDNRMAGVDTGAIADAVRRGLAGSVVVANVNIEELKRGLERYNDFENSIGN